MSRTLNELTHREHATLRAVADGRVEMSRGREPDLFVDGACCCDQVTAHHLAHEELLEPSGSAAGGARVQAVLTESGKHLLGL